MKGEILSVTDKAAVPPVKVRAEDDKRFYDRKVYGMMLLCPIS